MKKNKANNRGDRPVIVQSIVVKAPQRRVYDVGDWRAALRAADSGRIRSLYDLYEDIMIDGVLSDAVQKRIDAVTNSELKFLDSSGEEVTEVAGLMDTIAWETVLTEIIKTRIFGRSGVEMRFADGFTADVIPPKHIDLAKRVILRNETDEHGIPYEGDDHLLILGRERDYGLLLKAAPYAIYKRGGFGDWSQWIELFGMPQRIGKYNAYDPESRRLLEEAFERAGSAPYVVIPKESEVDTRESNAGSGTSYDEFRKANNEEILITILGQTLTTVQGERGARSLGEVHKEVEEGKNRSDLRFVQRILNQYVRPMLEARGIAPAGGKFVFPESVTELNVGEIVQLSTIMDIPQSYLHDKYSIPVPKDGEQIARASSTLLTIRDGDEEAVRNSDRGFVARLRDFFAVAPRDGATTGSLHTKLSDGGSIDDRLITGASEGRTFSGELFKFISDDFLQGVRGAFRRNVGNADMDYAYGLADDAFITALEMNLFHFSAAKTLAECQALNEAFRRSSSYTEFEKNGREICTAFNRTWQKTEYETAVLTAESASNYHRLKSRTRLFPYWKYVTAGDDRVRKEHRGLNGVILPVNDPRWGKIFPPNGWKCRCRVAGVMRHEVDGIDLREMRRRVDEYLGTPEWEMNRAQGWDVNRGEVAEIFSKNQQYIRKFPEKAARYLGKLCCTDFGLKTFSKRAAEAVVPSPVFAGNPADWHAAHTTLTDYMGRRVTFNGRSFGRDSHLLGCVADALRNPDEVWLNDHDGGDFKYLNFIKFYSDRVVNAVCEVKDGRTYQVTTWFEIDQKARPSKNRAEDPRWRYRRGLLIKG